MKVLIIEDDKDISDLVSLTLKKEGIVSSVASTGTLGLSKARRELPEMVILDLMLPEMNGLEVCRALKSDTRTKTIPIMILTAKGDEVDRIVGFEMGADDYLGKPFSPRELLLRIKAITKRSQEPAHSTSLPPLSVGGLSIDPERFEVKSGNHTIGLTAIEFKLLHYLVSTRGRVATRDSLLDRVWGYDSALTTRTVDTHIKRLRQKMGKAGDLIETIRGIGYRFRERNSST